MRTVSVTASRPYDVAIGPGLLQELGQRIAPLIRGRRAALVSDDVVAPLYASQAAAALEEAGFQVLQFVFPHGEQSKCGETYLQLLEFLAQNQLTRADTLIALGGGVTGDLTGFAAATYLRGVAYIQVPTTLLAMVDSSVGGKTAIDLPAGKNLAGAFYQPSYVLCDTGLLASLPREIFRDGCAEVVKYGVLGSRPLFDRLRQIPMDRQLEEVITTCVEMKRDVVAQDEFDTGTRQLLNLGHTIGHAVEAGSHFQLSHGQSVATGLAMIARAATVKGFCTPETRDEIVCLLRQYGLPVQTGQASQDLYRTALRDKKRQGGRLTLVVPREIGRCQLLSIPVEELAGWIDAGL